MKISRNTALLATAASIAVLTFLFWPAMDQGQSRFFADQTYHFQTLRALNVIPSGGADTQEVLETIKHIRAGDPQSWFEAWEATGDRVYALANNTNDRLSRGRAYFRAHSYYRTGEFLLLPDDPQRPAAWEKNVTAFYKGLDTLGITYKRIEVPYGEHHLNAVYYPGPAGAETKPLIVFVGGFDSTLEELYFALGAAALERGYSVLTYEGPGQGSVLREQDLPFTHEWEKPNGAVLDTFLQSHVKPTKIVLVGMSMGGYLAPRAAAFDERIDGVVAFDVFYDLNGAPQVPNTALWLRDHGFGFLVNAIIGIRKYLSPGFAWVVDNAMWTTGTKAPLDAFDTFKPYTLENVASQIRSDVLILAGQDDHFVPIEQVEQFEKALTHARSTTSVIYDRESGGAEHCQLGASTLWHATFFDWMIEKFPAAS
ncbi:MAG: alpha/beta hydrolase [Parvibaculum sp.]|nr:alpha/beta hydrolase [Parvibaculum sp.]